MDKLLIVEDEKLIRQGIRAMISRSGIPIGEILECNNGLAALSILKEQKIDVMFTDIRMPQMDGIELVKNTEGLSHKPFIVVISGYDDFSYAVEMLRTGVKEYMLKPVEREAIRSTLLKLEEELQQREADSRENISIGISQLKYILMNDNVNEREIRAAAGQFEEMLLSGEYCICCTGQSKHEVEGREGCLYLGELEGSSVYVIGQEESDKREQGEWEDCYAGVSLSHKSILELRKAYREAVSARKYAFCRKKKWMKYEEGMQQTAPDREENKDAAMKNLAQLIGTDRFLQVLKQLEKSAISVKLHKENPSYFETDIKSFTQAVIEIYAAVLSEGTDIDRFLSIYGFAEIDSFMEEYTGFLIGIHDRLDKEYGGYRNKQKIKQALVYLGESFDKDLNMAVVSNYVSMNYSLFSYEFKEYTGKNFVTYLKELRLNEAKCLLAETDLKVLEIGQRAGYDNEKHFMKVFKAEYGITPTEYRKNMQLN